MAKNKEYMEKWQKRMNKALKELFELPEEHRTMWLEDIACTVESRVRLAKILQAKEVI